MSGAILKGLQRFKHFFKPEDMTPVRLEEELNNLARQALPMPREASLGSGTFPTGGTPPKIIVVKEGIIVGQLVNGKVVAEL